MELQGGKTCFDFLHYIGVPIPVFISDHHHGIAKWIRESQADMSHYDLWHVVRSIGKKLLKASKEKSNLKIGSRDYKPIYTGAQPQLDRVPGNVSRGGNAKLGKRPLQQ